MKDCKEHPGMPCVACVKCAVKLSVDTRRETLREVVDKFLEIQVAYTSDNPPTTKNLYLGFFDWLRTQLDKDGETP